MPPANYTGPEPSDPSRPEQAYRPVAELTHDELCVELSEARQTLEAIYPYQDRATSARMWEIRDELSRRDDAAPVTVVPDNLRNYLIAHGWRRVDHPNRRIEVFQTNPGPGGGTLVAAFEESPAL